MNMPRKNPAHGRSALRAPDAYRQKLSRVLHQLKVSLKKACDNTLPEGRAWVGRAIADAATLAWAAPFPAVFFSVLVHTRVAQVYSQMMAASSPNSAPSRPIKL
jgi:hypothetical protein